MSGWIGEVYQKSEFGGVKMRIDIWIYFISRVWEIQSGMRA